MESPHTTNSHAVPRHVDEQPGLELHYGDGLEYDTLAPGREAEGLQPVTYDDQSKIAIGTKAYPAEFSYTDHNYSHAQSSGSPDFQWGHDGGRSYPSAATKAEGPTSLPRRRKALWITVGVVAVLVIIGAVVGGVLGSRGTSSTTTSSASSTSAGNSTSNVTALNNIRPLSRLAVTGWRDGSDYYRLRLFYQGPDQKLRMSSYSSNESAWSDPLTLTDLEHPAANNTALTACLSLATKPPEYKLMYLDENSILRGQGYKDYLGAAPQGTGQDLNDYPMTVQSTSRLASYWPFVMSQDSDMQLRWTRYDAPGQSAPWSNTTLDVTGSANAGMVILPGSAWYLDRTGFVYRRSDGKMKTYLADTNGNDTGTAWGSSELAESIPQNTAIGGFVVARQNNAKNLTNTYLLYQETSGTISVVWQDDTSGWKGPLTYDAFNGADNGTDITCLMPAAWNAAGVEISSNQNTNRCFFQVGSKVREVYYDGTNWNDQGYLPID